MEIRNTLRLGWVTYGLLALLAGIFYLERIAFLDMAFQCFQILRTGDFQIQSGRLGAAGTQFFPWAAQTIGLPLKGVLLSYSIGHVAYYLILFLLVTQVLKQWRWGLVLLLLATLMTTHTFYWLSELPQGLAFLTLLFAWMHTHNSLRSVQWWAWPIFIFAIYIAVYFHPMNLYAMVFCSMFFSINALQTRFGASKTTSMSIAPSWGLQLTGLALFILIVFIKYKVLKLDWYDAMSLERAEAFGQLWPNWFNIQSNRDFLRWCVLDYYLLPIVFGASFIFYLWQKQWLKALLITLFPISYILLVNIPFHTGDRQFYLENLYTPLGLFAAVPLIFDVLPGLVGLKRMFWIVGIMIGIRLLHIAATHTTWSERLHWEQRFLTATQHADHKKLVLNEKDVPMDKMLLSWGMAYECLLLSALPHPDSARCIVVDENPERFDSLMTRPTLLLGEFKNYTFDQLPRQYFNLRDTSQYIQFNSSTVQ